MIIHAVGLILCLALGVESNFSPHLRGQHTELVRPRFANTHTEETRWRRSASGEFEFPEELIFSVDVGNTTVTIALQRSHVNNVNPSMFQFKDGQVTKIETESTQNKALYQDVYTGAAYLVSCDGPTQAQCSLHGSFYNQLNRYQMTPHDSFDTSGLHEIDEIETEDMEFKNDFRLPPESARNENLQPDNDRKKRDDSDNSRSKRSDSNINIVEFLAVTDESVYETFRSRADTDEAAMADIQIYYAFLLNEIDLHYLSVPLVDPSLRIRVALTGVVIATTEDGAPWSADNTYLRGDIKYLDAHNALSEFSDWRNTYRQLFPQHDHAMAFTMKDYAYVYDDDVSSGLLGTAYLSQVCRSWDTSITEDNSWRVALIGAHELGHSLGAYHDTSSTCPSRLRFIMAPSLSYTVSEFYAENQWTFSSCSVDDFDQHINRLYSNCMMDHAIDTSSFIEDVPHTLPGEFYTLDQQCQMANGPQSQSCVTTVPEAGCHTGYRCDSNGCGYGSYYAYYPLAGSPCGNPEENKWCYKGVCVEKPSNRSTTSPPTLSSSPTSSPNTTATPSTSSPNTSSSTTTPSNSTTPSPSSSTSPVSSTTPCPKFTTSNSTSTTTITTPTPTTTTPTTTTVNPCKTRCCKKRGRRKKCCIGKRCCKRRWGKSMPCCQKCQQIYG